MMEQAKLDEILELPPEERLTLAAAIWDSLVAEPEGVPVPDWHRKLIARRAAEDAKDLKGGESWAELRSRIEGDE